MFVALVPFSTAILGEYTIFATTTMVSKGANFVLILLFYYIIWWYVTKNKHLLHKDISPPEVMRLKIGTVMPTILFLVAIGLSFISPYIGIAIYITIILSGFVLLITSKTYHSCSEESK